MRTKYIAVMLLFQLLFGCSNPKPARKDFIGTWKAADGAILELRNDSTCTIKKLNYRNIYSFKGDTTTILNVDGQWQFVNVKGEPQIDISYSTGETYQYKGETKLYKKGFPLNIAGEGMLGNKAPWHVFVWIGDPDDMNKYKFEKQ